MYDNLNELQIKLNKEREEKQRLNNLVAELQDLNKRMKKDYFDISNTLTNGNCVILTQLYDYIGRIFDRDDYEVIEGMVNRFVHQMKNCENCKTEDELSWMDTHSEKSPCNTCKNLSNWKLKEKDNANNM